MTEKRRKEREQQSPGQMEFDEPESEEDSDDEGKY